MQNERTELKDLIATAAAKERLIFAFSMSLTVVAVVAGFWWIAHARKEVSRLEQQGSELRSRNDDLQKEIRLSEVQLAEVNKKIEEAKAAIANSEQALQTQRQSDARRELRSAFVALSGAQSLVQEKPSIMRPRPEIVSQPTTGQPVGPDQLKRVFSDINGVLSGKEFSYVMDHPTGGIVERWSYAYSVPVVRFNNCHQVIVSQDETKILSERADAAGATQKSSRTWNIDLSGLDSSAIRVGNEGAGGNTGVNKFDRPVWVLRIARGFSGRKIDRDSRASATLSSFWIVVNSEEQGLTLKKLLEEAVKLCASQ